MNSDMKTMTRSAVTLIEVVFAIGVALIGLVGLMSILPLAGNQAQEAVSLDAGAALADSIANEVLAAGLIRNVALRPLDSPSTAGLISSTSPILVVDPFCIDPMLCALAPTNNESYNANFFPFYEPNHDPLLDPSIATSTPTTPSGFDGQPRLRRAFPEFLNSVPTAQKLEVARATVESVDHLPFVRPKDRSKPAALSGLTATSSSSISFGKIIPTGEFSWIITVDPTENSRFAMMSVVVMRNRERLSDFPASNQETPRGNALAERVALVTDATGFNGGGGGTVQLTSSANTLSNLRSGDWLMLSRNTRPDILPASSKPSVQVHRWYRVVAVAGDAKSVVPTSDTVVDGVTIPAPGDSSVTRSASDGSNAVWQRTVILDGSDWAFSAFADSMNATTNSLTYATLVDDVVAVAERTISLSDF